MKLVNVGVIGVGRMGQRHCRVYSNLRKTQLAGVCDSNPEVGRKVADQFEVPYYATIPELLEHVDAVSLATPTPLHYEQALQCIDQDKHLLIEKPIAETLDQAEVLAQRADDCGLVVQVGHIERFNPAYIELKNVVENMEILAVDLKRLSAFQGSNKDVDVVLDLMIHDTNLILDMMKQDPVVVNAIGKQVFSDNLDHATAFLEFENGVIVTVTASRVTEQKIRSIDVTCRDAYLDCDLLNKSISISRSTIGEMLSFNSRGVKYRQESIVERIFIPTYEPLYLQQQHFIDCILDSRTPDVSARDGLKAMRLAIQIRDLCLSNFKALGVPATMPDISA
jgi:virulence factor